MARRPQPRHITLGGREAVALTVEEYEQLLASRRQIGGQSARVRVLALEAKRTEQLLRNLETLVGTSDGGCGASAGAARSEECPTVCVAGALDADCLRCAIAELLRRHRDTAA
ncbi:hypothetical protein OHT57_45195 [Streptomyces sp. NBC_00285]|uniref:hypothetical protein n=1 Tax=Streptomyces sp. NBC_00285 TaxID=2975700 RepID=UPI002E2AEDA7|nr:hypothetical protein [Streptomyces sp. NBC_00285]